MWTVLKLSWGILSGFERGRKADEDLSTICTFRIRDIVEFVVYSQFLVSVHRFPHFPDWNGVSLQMLATYRHFFFFPFVKAESKKSQLRKHDALERLLNIAEPIRKRLSRSNTVLSLAENSEVHSLASWICINRKTRNYHGQEKTSRYLKPDSNGGLQVAFVAFVSFVP